MGFGIELGIELGFPGSSTLAAGPGHVHKVYTGDLPWSM